MTQHRVKIESHFFEAVRRGEKKAEVRFNDRDYQTGDELVLVEVEKVTLTGKYPVATTTGIEVTGRELTKRISYMSTYEQKEGYVVLSMGEPSPLMRDNSMSIFKTLGKMEFISGVLPDRSYLVNGQRYEATKRFIRPFVGEIESYLEQTDDHREPSSWERCEKV